MLDAQEADLEERVLAALKSDKYDGKTDGELDMAACYLRNDGVSDSVEELRGVLGALLERGALGRCSGMLYVIPDGTTAEEFTSGILQRELREHHEAEEAQMAIRTIESYKFTGDVQRRSVKDLVLELLNVQWYDAPFTIWDRDLFPSVALTALWHAGRTDIKTAHIRQALQELSADGVVTIADGEDIRRVVPADAK
jgi:hypothetical protein